MHTILFTDTPDSLNELSDTESMFSHAQALKSRQERKHPEPLRKEKTEEWGDKEEWFGESKADFKSEVFCGMIINNDFPTNKSRQGQLPTFMIFYGSITNELKYLVFQHDN